MSPVRPEVPRTHWLLAGALGLVLIPAADLGAQPAPWVPQQQPPPPRRSPPPVGAFTGVMVVFLAIWMAQQKLRQEEEEEVTPHIADPSMSFEYKIVRNSMGAFKHPARFKAMLEEEARAGWELFEKLDCSRARLRRLTAWRDKDADLTQDPYRTRYGAGDGKIALWIVLGVLLALGLIAGILIVAIR